MPNPTMPSTMRFLCFFVVVMLGWGIVSPAATADEQVAQSEGSSTEGTEGTNTAPPLHELLELPPTTVEGSPVLQQWYDEVPDVLNEIRHDPSFRTRLQVGYAQFPSTNGEGGFRVGIEDYFIGDTPLTVSAQYQGCFSCDRETYGADLRYYMLPLGGYINVAPVVGYRHIQTDTYATDGLEVGFQVKVMPSRGGGADFAYTQTWIDPTGSETVRTTQFEFGYAITRHLRLATELQWQFAPGETDSQIGVELEWLL
jgi:hypothetical protein